jgi:hypothetical protein
VKPSELVRTGLWLVLAAWIGAALWREARRPLSSPSAT